MAAAVAVVPRGLLEAPLWRWLLQHPLQRLPSRMQRLPLLQKRLCPCPWTTLLLLLRLQRLLQWFCHRLLRLTTPLPPP